MFVYAMRGGGYAKIGVSDDIEKRLTSFNRGALPFEMNIVCLAETDTNRALQMEADILDLLPGRLRGEWLDGAASDAEIVEAFKSWPVGNIWVFPTAKEVADANRATARQRQLEASRAVVNAMEARASASVDWRRIATELTERGDIGALRKVKKAFKSKRLVAQNRVSR